MFLLSLMSQREAVQRVQNEQASLLEAHGIPKFGDTLPENTAMTGDICMASIPSEAAYMPAVDVSQLSGGID